MLTVARVWPADRTRIVGLRTQHLGLKLYSSLPPVIAELVSNAWDADAKKVEITFPSGTLSPASEVVVRDYGIGMAP